MYTATILKNKRSFAIISATSAAALGTIYYFTRGESLGSTVVNEKPSTFWHPPARHEILNRLKGKSSDGNQMLSAAEAEFDLLIIGGGATGTGCALDAAARGLKVACVEREDFSSGTSSRSTKLVHGGVRYLEKAFRELDYEQYKLVKEALFERATFLKVAPYLAGQLPIMLPIYKWYQVPYYWAGSKAYDILAGKRSLESSYFLPKSKALKAFPMLKSNGLCGAMVYYDGQHNDARMNIALALTAAQMGATITNYVEVVELIKSTLAGNEIPQITGAVLRDRLTDDEWTVKAKGVINATGPFCDAIRKMDEPNTSTIVAPSAGVHIVLPDFYSPRDMGLVDPATSDGRVIFFLPWEGVTIAGTTDTPTNVSYNPMPTEKDVDFILNEVSHYLGDDVTVRKSDVLAAWSGIRPLVRDPSATTTQGIVRNHLINVSESGLLTIAGGKWTTYRNMAYETINKAIKIFKLKPTKEINTEDVLLIGSHGYSKNMYLKLIQQYGLEMDVAQHLCNSYGDRAFSVAALSEPGSHRWPFLGRRLVPSHPYIESEVKYAVRNEMAVSVVDVLARRTRLAFIDVQAAYELIPKVVEIMGTELKWSPTKRQEERSTAAEYLKCMGLGIVTPFMSHFSKEEILKFREEFSSMDSDCDGAINLSDLKVIITRVGMKPDSSLMKIAFSGLENKRLEFSEFLEIMTKIRDEKTKKNIEKSIQDMQGSEAISTERSGGGL